MDEDRLAQEVALLRTAYPDLEDRGVDGTLWVRIPAYPVPEGWSAGSVEIAFQIPIQVGQAPYAFYVRPALRLANGDAPTNYTPTATTPWGNDFAQFSWSPVEQWISRANVREGANMLNFARSFAERLKDPT
jgi:hypothetical protein